MNTPILKLFLLVVVLFAGLIAWTSRWTVFEADALRTNALNQRELLEEQRIRRGPIRDREGRAIARSEPGRAETFSRRYPAGQLFGHPVGYSFLSLGRSSLEQFYNDDLSGREDDIESIFDDLSGAAREGDELRTSLDAKAQQAAYDALGGQRGAVVAIEPKTGKVRVMASNPSYDPDQLRDARSLESVDGEESRLLNRTTSGLYPPGSTFKVVTAAAAIDSGKFTKDSMEDGSSPQTISGTPLKNFANEQFGQIPLTLALTKSVNTVWAKVGVSIGGDTMQEYMERFGFYDRVKVDLPAEERDRSGVYVKGRRLTKMTSRRVDVGRAAIGQGGLLATPLQMAMVAATVANDGRLMEPQIVDRIVDRDGRTVDDVDPEEKAEVMKPSTAKEVGDMMASVVREGTGTAAALEGVSVAGKTGTAEILPAQNVNQPWFIGFAPRDNPRIAIAVTVERSTGTGGEVAGPIAKRVLQELAG